MVQKNVRAVSVRTRREFWEIHADSEPALRAWNADAERAIWNSPQDINRRYANASVLADNRVCFNIKGNDFRLIVHINYEQGIIFIKFIGTHAQYDRIKAESVGKPDDRVAEAQNDYSADTE